jgi:riboflavin kinase/FMN adenylyltransferase
MQTISGSSQLEKVEKGCVLTIGNFDGVHLGHKEILVAASKAAAERAVPLVVMTFEPHPLAVLRPEKAPGALTPPALKEHLVGRFGTDWFFVVQSNSELLALSAEEFIRRFLRDGIEPSLVVEGESFNFGSGRRGSIETLLEAGKKNGFEVSIVPPKEVRLSSGRTAAVSSTLIRNLLLDGSVGDAVAALGRPYRLIEKVVAGRGKGKRLGFPTANMKLPQQVIPAEGVYAGFAATADDAEEIFSAEAKIPAALSIGRTATYGKGQSLLIEAHLLAENVPGLYDKHLAMDFVQRIRGQRKFKTESDLAAQIAKDCERIGRILKC